MKQTIELVINTYKVDGQFLNDWTIKLKVSNSTLRVLLKIIEELKKFDDPATPKIYIRILEGYVA